MRWVYTAWFRDSLATPEDEDREWVACILIEASSESDAHAWGDHLARSMCSRITNEEFVGSEVRSPDDRTYMNVAIEDLPTVAYGVEASDEQIGW